MGTYSKDMLEMAGGPFVVLDKGMHLCKKQSAQIMYSILLNPRVFVCEDGAWNVIGLFVQLHCLAGSACACGFA
jgi:hypothetical protein